mmetsp:Transcript_9041/g.20773  ORF Transcript_9041/g.20773 Transcript_9041/m.20773 type:complete len:290 (-) Transcript_9041:64-933(-)
MCPARCLAGKPEQKRVDKAQATPNRATSLDVGNTTTFLEIDQRLLQAAKHQLQEVIAFVRWKQLVQLEQKLGSLGRYLVVVHTQRDLPQLPEADDVVGVWYGERLERDKVDGELVLKKVPVGEHGPVVVIHAPVVVPSDGVLVVLGRGRQDVSTEGPIVHFLIVHPQDRNSTSDEGWAVDLTTRVLAITTSNNHGAGLSVHIAEVRLEAVELVVPKTNRVHLANVPREHILSNAWPKNRPCVSDESQPAETEHRGPAHRGPERVDHGRREDEGGLFQEIAELLEACPEL